MPLTRTILFLCLAAFCGCTYWQPLPSLKEKNRETMHDVHLITRDSGVYTLSAARLQDSVLFGMGTLRRSKNVTPFSGEIPYNQILYAEVKSASWFKVLVGVLGAGAFISVAYSAGASEQGLQRAERTHYESPYTGGGSCPFVYVDTGGGYALQSETIAGAVSKLKELTALDRLLLAKVINGKLRLLLTSERPETEHLDELTLQYVDVPHGCSAFADDSLKLHTLRKIYSPVFAHDRNGDCREVLAVKDGNYWESHIEQNPLKTPTELRDEIILTFRRPAGYQQAKLVVHGENTKLGPFALNMIYSFAGERKLEWQRSLDNDTLESRKLAEFMQSEGNLHVSVLEGTEWNPQSWLRDSGPEIARTGVVPIDLSRVVGDSIAIKLSTTTDLWKLDQVGLDFSEDEQLTLTQVQPAKVSANDKSEVASLLLASDSKYLDMIPGDSVSLEYEAPPTRDGFDRQFFLRTRGFYHVWSEAKGPEKTMMREMALANPKMAELEALRKWKKEKSER